MHVVVVIVIGCAYRRTQFSWNVSFPLHIRDSTLHSHEVTENYEHWKWENDFNAIAADTTWAYYATLPPSLLCVCAGNWYRVSLEITNLKKKELFWYCALDRQIHAPNGTKSAATICLWNAGVDGTHYTHYYCCVRKCEPCLSTYENDFPGSYSYMSCHVGRRRPTRARAQYTA